MMSVLGVEIPINKKNSKKREMQEALKISKDEEISKIRAIHANYQSKRTLAR